MRETRPIDDAISTGVLETIAVSPGLPALGSSDEAYQWVDAELQHIAAYETAATETVREYVMGCEDWRLVGARQGATRYHVLIATLASGEDGSAQIITVEYAQAKDRVPSQIRSFADAASPYDECPGDIADIIKQNCQDMIILERYTADSVNLRRQYANNAEDTLRVVMGSDWERSVKWGTLEHSRLERALREGHTYATVSMSDRSDETDFAKGVIGAVKLMSANKKAEHDTRWMEYRDAYNHWQASKDEAERARLVAVMDDILQGEHWSVLFDRYDQSVETYQTEFTWDAVALDSLRFAIGAEGKPDLTTGLGAIHTQMPDASLAVYLEKVNILVHLDRAVRKLQASSTPSALDS